MSEFETWDELGPPEMRPVPEGHAKARTAAVVAAIVIAGVFLVAVGIALIARGRGGPKTPGGTTTPPVTITESFTVTASPSATSTTVTPTTAGTSAVSTVPEFTRVTRVAYRQDGALWVAEESGAGPRRVVTSTAGAFSLSPDGSKLAVVDASTKTLAVVEVESSRSTTVGPADVRPAVWAPDSKWLAFTNGTEVRRVEGDGTKMRYLGKGTQVAIGPDALAYAFGSEGAVTYVAKGKTTRLTTAKGRLDSVALASAKLFYAVGGASRSALSLHSVGLDGNGDKQLAGAPSDTKAGMYDDLTLSPDGTWLAYAVTGDDLHSRLRAMHTDGTLDTPLSLRHDDYLLKWSAEGTKLFFIDGNVLQGDATQLMSVRPDGTMRLTVLRGAGI